MLCGPAENVAEEQEGGENHESGGVLAAVVEHKSEDSQILESDEEGLAVGGDGVVAADVVGEGDDTGEGLEHVGVERDALGGAGLNDLDDLGYLDDGTTGDDSEAEAL